MLYDLDADPGVERPIEIGNGADMIVRAATAFRVEEAGSVRPHALFRPGLGTSSARASNRNPGPLPMSNPRLNGMRAIRSVSAIRTTPAPKDRSRAAEMLMPPIKVAIVLDRARVDGRQEIRVGKK